MKSLLTILLIICCNAFAFAQGGAMADLKFEEAEIAFSENDYKTTIIKLDEFDQLFGSVTVKSLYLRIVSQDKMVNDKGAAFSTLMSLRKNAAAYLKAMESEGLDDKFRDVYNISEKIKQLPTDEAAWTKSITDKEDAIKKIGLRFDNAKWMEGIKLGDSYTTLKQNFPTLKKTADIPDGRVLWDIPEFYQYQDFSKPNGIFTENGIVTEYGYHLNAFYLKDEVDSKSAEFANKVKAHFSTAEIFSKTNEDGFVWYAITVPYSKTMMRVGGLVVAANSEYYTQVRVVMISVPTDEQKREDLFSNLGVR